MTRQLDLLPTVLKPITKRQLQVLNFVKKYIAQNGYAPTAREIAAHFGFTAVNGAQQHIDALITKGFLLKTPRIARGLTLPKNND